MIKTGKFVDRFNSEVIFPVNNITGDTIALEEELFVKLN